MVKGVNELGESSEYLYNGLGALVQNTWTIKKNAYGYHDVTAAVMVEGEIVVDKATGKKEKKDKKDPETVLASPELNKTSTVVKEFVVDYTTETFEPLMEHEVNGLDYRYVYGNDRLSVNITGVETSSGNLVENGNQIRLYYHMDYLGTADYLTSPVSLKVESWTHYNEWGEITHNAVLKCGQRELDLVKRYATHDYDAVLGLYYAKARFYDPQEGRFTAIDPIQAGTNWYAYVGNSPLVWIDPLGLVQFVPIYINGDRYDNMVFIDNNTAYVTDLSGRAFARSSGVGQYVDGVREVSINPDAKLPYEGFNAAGYKTKPAYQIGDNKLYYQQFECNLWGVKLRSIAEVAGAESALSWWSEDGRMNFWFNPDAVNKPVQVQREGDRVIIVVYASFVGDANAVFDNRDEASRAGKIKDGQDYISQYGFTYKQLVIQGMKEWANYYEAKEKNGIRYDDFGDYRGVNVVVHVKEYDDNPEQDFLEIAIKATTPTERPLPGDSGEVSRTYGGSTSWSVGAGKSRVEMYDHTWHLDDQGNLLNSEYSETEFMHTAKHEFGHVLGLADAYGTSNFPEAESTDEVPREPNNKMYVDTVMRRNGPVDSNAIEMLLEAWKTNEWQSFSDYNDGSFQKSTVIRL